MDSYGGVPAFNEYISQIKPAFDVVKERLKIERNNPKAPTLKIRLLKWNAPVVILSVS
jgi:hypothetical protein